MKYLQLVLLPVAVVIGVCLIPVAFIIAIPDIIRSIKDALHD